MNKRKYRNLYYDVRPISNLKEMIESCAELYADKPAFKVKDRPGGVYCDIMYWQLKDDIDALGTAFISLGLKGKKIAVIGENSYTWVITYLATVNGTGVIVPLDRELPAKEIRNLLHRADVNAIVYSKKLEKTIVEILPEMEGIKTAISMAEDHDPASLCIPDLLAKGRELMAEGNREFLDAEINNEEMCSLLFTSGTTGLAKGVMLSHKNITANVYNMSKYVRIIKNGIGLSVLPMHHSYEMTCHIFTGLYQGMAIAICEGLKYIQKNMAEVHATVMLGVPLIFEAIHKKIWKQAENSGKADKLRLAIALSKKFKLYNNQALVRKMFADIHTMTGNNVWQFIAGGAAINPKVIEDFEAMGFPMIQGYGMTENAPIIAVNRDVCSKSRSVGTPMPETEVRILNPDASGMGEVICKGPSVMIGYYDNPEETEKVLVDGWLHTGDYGYFDDEGYLYITGRKKNVIVTKNGKNIFPEEVEFYLMENKYILEALVHGVEDEKTGDTVVKAEVYPNFDLIKEEQGDLDIEQLRKFIKTTIDEINEQMPLYKRVKRFSIRETEFEKTTTRKIKRYTAVNFGGHSKHKENE
ncbi:MAG: AMP-binding protein [Clostridia bacterium]|nr:AMP-binding protein [Clostridia bacterium]